MHPQADEGTQLYRRGAMIAAGLVVGLITLGGVVRITGSGMGCGDHWPLCNGRILPNLSDILEVIEWSHRWVAALVSFAVVALAVIAWRRHRSEPALRNPALFALGVLVLQIVLGAVTVKLWNAAPTVVVHLTNAMVLLGILVVAVLRAGERLRGEQVIPGRGPTAALMAPGFALLVVVFGAFVANYDAGLYCLGFPLCAGSLVPPAEALGKLQWVHRVLAFLFVGHSLGVAFASRRLTGEGSVAYRRAAWALAALVILQVSVGAAMVLSLLPTSLRAAHLFVGSLVWTAAIVLAFRSRRMLAARTARLMDPALDPATSGEFVGAAEIVHASPEQAPAPSMMADLVTLTKPRIISLLLLTTVAPMYITGRGVPPLSLVLWVIVGGYLMAGGANTVNMWFDRDIDMLMSRTRLRPIPSGRIPAIGALLFGLGQGGVAFWIFWHFVNPLSAWLAFSGYLFYVFVYTVWLKRISAQNIVIGGAAGAFPPLVGWTAMTGTLDLPAIYLFAIIFFWTPPHFWALALIKKQDYAKAGIPMMPVVQGDHWTKIQMLAYTLMLIPLTLMPSIFGALGLFYAAAALGLGGRLLWYSIRVLREAGVTPTAWKMYKYSLLYLALLFVAMGIDRTVPFGHEFERAPLLILDRPESEALAPGAAVTPMPPPAP
jgi:protoheme IX farnesyltransferase